MLNANHLIQNSSEVIALVLISFMIFAESGLLIGIILPGDSLLLAAGVFAGRGKLPIGWLLFLVIISAIIGYEVGYSLGRRIGPRLFKRKDGFLFREEYITKTEQYFGKYGPITLVLARFVANVRTLVSAIAGASRMDRGKYFVFNVVGAVFWGGGVTLLGYWLGANVPNIDKFIIPALLIGLALLYSVTVWKLTQTPEKRRSLKKGLREDYEYFFNRKKV